MAKELGADSLRYLPVDAIARAVGLSKSQLCRACVTGHYPTPAGEHLYQIDNVEAVSGGGDGHRGVRSYERTC